MKQRGAVSGVTHLGTGERQCVGALAVLPDGRDVVATDLIRSTTDDRLLDEVYDVTGTNSSKSLE